MPRTCETPGTLLSKTKQLLSRDKRHALALHRDTGLPFYWLRDFKRGVIINPSVNRVQTLYEALSGKTLIV